MDTLARKSLARTLLWRQYQKALRKPVLVGMVGELYVFVMWPPWYKVSVIGQGFNNIIPFYILGIRHGKKFIKL
jgi:hypothetical protein